MIRVLHYVGQMDIGGIESLIMSIYKNIDKEKFEFDFAVHTEKKCFYDDEIISYGGSFHRFPVMRKNPIAYKKMWNDFWFKYANYYDVFHFHTPTFANIIAMKAAKKYGVKVVIAHCHNTHANKGKMQFIHDIIHKYHSNRISKYANCFLACSPDAARWGFGDQYLSGNLHVEILKNGIDLTRFQFSHQTRLRLREMLGISDKYVLGNVGRLCAQKNQSFAIEIFNKIKATRKNAILLLVGTGSDEPMLREIVKKYSIEDSVLFLGARADVPDLMMCMDAFLFPSVHEGLGIVMIEAQAIGLPVYASKNRIPNEAKVSDYVSFIELESGAESWAKTILDDTSEPFVNKHSEIINHGYDILTTTQRYQEILTSIIC